ncbi:tRNA (N(6)-L-threonylcarbamoyladenosine(37)-C(2))-methylthiotransferase MtaB [Desulfolithobacter sp.]
MKKIAITTLGCKVNQYESSSFISGFEERGCDLVPFSSDADVYVINTCAVTGRAGQQSRQMIRRAMRSNPNARLIITGCYAQICSREILDIVDRDVCIIGNGNKHLLVDAALAEEQSNLSMLMTDISTRKEICHLPVRRMSGRTRAYLRIQDGCNNFCSYCIVPYTRGRSRSVAMDEVLRQARVFDEQGYRELVVTGINVGKYGLDLKKKNLSIYSLLDRLCREFPHIRIRLSSVEPTEVNDELLELFGHRNFMPHLHIPLQSGDNEVLARMNRRYTAENFIQVIKRILGTVPHAAIGCDVLGGFPGETDRAAENTCNLLHNLPIAYLHVFPYSRRPGTLAARMENQVAKGIKDERVRRLRELDQLKRQEFYRNHLGRTVEVLVERRNKKTGLLQGFSDNYIPVQLKGPGRLVRSVVTVRLDHLDDDHVHGILEEQYT